MTDKTKIDVVVERLRREKKKEKRRVLFLGMLSIVVFLLIWQSVCVFHIVGGECTGFSHKGGPSNFYKDRRYQAGWKYAAPKYLEQF